MRATRQQTLTQLAVAGLSEAYPERVQTAHRSTFLEPFFWTGELLDNFRLKDGAIFHGSIFNPDPRAPGHVTSCLQLMLFGCTRAICELKGIYNV